MSTAASSATPRGGRAVHGMEKGGGTRKRRASPRRAAEPAPSTGESGPPAAAAPSEAGGQASPLALSLGLFERARGLLFRRPGDEAMLFLPCNDIHTVGMRRRIDVAFVDATGLVMEAHRDVGPLRRLRNRGAVAVLERFSTTATPWLEPGDRLGIIAMKGERQ